MIRCFLKKLLPFIVLAPFYSILGMFAYWAVIGEPFHITSYFYKNVCPASVDTLITLSDNTIVSKTFRPVINPSDGDQVVKELLAPGVPAGKYLLKRSIIYDCHNKSYMLSYPTVSFEVINN